MPWSLRAQAPAADSEDARLHDLLTAQVERALQRDPTTATALGLDTGTRAALRSLMPEWSAAGRAADREETARSLRDLHAIDRRQLSERAAVSYDIAEFDLVQRDRLGRLFPFHTSGFGHRPGPYGVTQLQGFYTAVSNFFDSQQPVNDRADAEAYLARAAALPRLFDDDTRITLENAASGIVAPRFILEKAIRQVSALRDGEARDKTSGALARPPQRRARADRL